MNERTINPDFSKLIENYEKFAEVLREEDPKCNYFKRRISKVSCRKTCFWI